MVHLLDILVAGLSSGIIYALIAIGFTLIFKATGVLNFAHGSLLLLGAFVTAKLSPDLGFWPAFAVGALAAGVMGVLLDRVIFRWVDASDHVSLAVITLGIDMLLLGELTRIMGTRVMSLGDPWADQLVTLGPITLPATRIAATMAASLLLVLFFVLLRYTNWGLSMRASTQDSEAAVLVGIRPWRISSSAWAVGGILAAVAGVFLCMFPAPGVTPSVAEFALKAFPAAVIGGLGSLGGAVVGGLMLGIAEALVIGYAGQLAFLGSGFVTVVPYIVLVVVLLIRPSGLFSRREVARV